MTTIQAIQLRKKWKHRVDPQACAHLVSPLLNVDGCSLFHNKRVNGSICLTKEFRFGTDSQERLL